MEIVYIGYVAVGLLGLIMGSFAGATVWRLRAKQLVDDDAYLVSLKKKKKSQLSAFEADDLAFLAAAKAEREVESKRLRRLNGIKMSEDRSQCLDCGHTLAWYDLVPLVSWVSTSGRCRYCKKRIGLFEPMMEVGMAAAFVLFYHIWVIANGLGAPGLLVTWLVLIVMFGILFAYDLKWFILPDRVMLPVIGISLLYAGYMIIHSSDIAQSSIDTVLSIGILSGLYLALWLISKGRWIGFGDVKLGLALGLLLMDWKLALLALFLANLIGVLVILPGMVTGALSRKTQIPFGPFLILGFFIALLFGTRILQAYDSFSMWLSTTMLML